VDGDRLQVGEFVLRFRAEDGLRQTQSL
jgi:hypothetical protein